MDFRPPAPLTFSAGNVKEKWKKWRQELDNYMLATEKHDKPDKIKIAILLNLLGSEGLEIFNTFEFATPEEKGKYTAVLESFQNYCSPRQNVVYERYKFFSCIQQEGQTIECYVTQLKTLASTCEFADQESGLIRDRIVLGIRDHGLKERLLRESNLELEKAVEIVRAAETSREQLRNMKDDPATVNSIKKNRRHQNLSKQSMQPKQSSQPKQSTLEYDCKKCGRRHKYRECPAFGKTCAKCKLKNHFAIRCPKNVHEMRLPDSESNLFVDSVMTEVTQSELKISVVHSEQGNFIDSVNKNIHKVSETWVKSVTLVVNDKDFNVDFKLDTGAEVNILPSYVLNSVNIKPKLNETNLSLTAYGDFKLKPEGTLIINCSTEKLKNVPIQFYIVNVKSKPILGLRACSELKLIQRIDSVKCNISKQNLITQYKDVFTGTGEFPDEPYHITLKDDARPVIHPPRRVPQALQPRLKETLEKLEKEGIVSKVNKPTDWVQSLVIVEKPNGNLRLCLDPRDLNKVIKREHYQIPSPDDIISRLEGKKIFSVVDLKDGFWHVPLDEISSEICTFNTPFGRYKFNKMPFGISSAPEIFQKRNQKLFGDIEGVEVYFDDIIIAGSDEAKHDVIMSKVLERARSLNIKFNPDKLQYRVPEVKYVGQIISESGVKADPSHIKAIIDMPTPKSKTEVRRLLGMINFLSKFIPNVSTVTAPLREIIHENVEFSWGGIQEESFSNIKQLLTKTPILKVFSANDEIIIQCDSSKDGLGSCLIQKGQPVSFVSRSLTNSEKNYAQIEKELLAIVFSFEKYHNFVYGRKVTVQSDHKPLMAIVKKPLHKISSRMQRMILKLLKYDFEINYVPGNQMFLADTLSRAFPVNETIKDDPEMLDVVHSISKYLPMSERRLAQFKKETELDSDLQMVMKYIKEGWPKCYKKVDSSVKTYYKVKNDLHINNGLLFINEKIVVPHSLRKDMLQLVHEAHFGIEKCKNRAREIFYWPGMANDIEQIVSNCQICEKFRNKNPKEPLMPHEIPNKPFAKIALDILQFGNQNYLVVVDYYSKWIETSIIKDKTANEIMEKLKCIFAQYGIPNEVICDNNPCNSYVFKKFAEDWDFELKFSSPRFPQSNGMAEKAVGIVKNILRKVQDINIGLMEYRNTPISGLNLSPAQLLYNRRLRTKLPISCKLLNTEFHNPYSKFCARQAKQKHYYDRTAQTLPELKSGDSILLYNFRTGHWDKGEILSKHKAPRSYIVRNVNGEILRRNRKHIKLSKTPCEYNNVYDDLEGDNRENSNKNSDNLQMPVNKNGQNLSMSVNRTGQNIPNNITRKGRLIKQPSKFKDFIME